jgi:hypothetical protein
MKTCTLPEIHTSTDIPRIRVSGIGGVGRLFALAKGFAAGLFSRRASRASITSPGQALSGFRITREDADLLRRISDPKSTVGKPTLRAGPAMRR